MSTKVVDSLAPGLEGSKTEYTALAAAVVNVVIIVLQLFFGIVLPEGLWEGINTVFGGAIALFLGSRMSRTNELVKIVEANQVTEKPEIIVTDTRVVATGAKVVSE